jgi:hypothetical protein
LQQVAGYTGAHRSQEVFLVGVRCDDDGSEGSTICGIESRDRRKPWGSQRVDDHDIAFGIKYAECRLLSVATLSNNEKIGTLAEEPDERFTQQTVLNN